MYVPRPFEVNDLVEIKKFVEFVGAADLVTTDLAGVPLATLMPCQWKSDETEFGQLIMHMSKGNAQWKEIQENQIGLAIIHGFQAYVTPNSYATKSESGKVVPTWNYTSVHLTGRTEVITNQQELLKIVTELTDTHEASQLKPWKVLDAPEDYLASQLNGIVGIVLKIEKVEAKAKLNQNRTTEDRAGVIKTLKNSQNFQDQAVAALMSSEENQPNKLI